MPSRFFIKISQAAQNIFKPGEVYRNINGTKPVFKKPLSGEELAKILAASGLSKEEVSFTIERALRKMNFNPTQAYTPAQLQVFADGVVQALKDKYPSIVEKLI